MAEMLYLFDMLLESNDSSSEDELNLLLRHVGDSKPKINNFINIVREFDDETFRKNFRIRRRTCTRMIEHFENSQFFPKTGERGVQVKSAETHVLSFLWFAGNKCCMRDVAGRFGMAESTFHTCLKRILDYLIDIAPTFVSFPTSQEGKLHISRKFEDVSIVWSLISGITGILGCIDGTFIPIRTPVHKLKSTYVNRHDFPSITLQAICDSDKRFLDLFTGVSSKIHDARVFKLSNLSNKLRELCGVDFHILGDAAYPLKQFLITPYRDYGNLSPEQTIFNMKFSRARVKIENAFGLLKQRFRQLIRTDFDTVDMTSKFIVSCCVLHNMCIDEGDDWVEEEQESAGDNSSTNNAGTNDVCDHEERERG
ncbi:hypothetical protein RN001_002582 [Aquatica leii]|uniref:DDE Tnp4 domain-containing protein n=1 Tax=Aquatica leii TaxID=1421715 RepID=A0AAN7PQ12_9COLE|nr:hypothetical protein RN001_002582 [Aquatica leii]